MELAGEWSALCSQRPGPECTSTDVFRSKYGNGYDEEESLNDYTSGDYSYFFVWYHMKFDYLHFHLSFSSHNFFLSFSSVPDSYICMGKLFLLRICSRYVLHTTNTFEYLRVTYLVD